MSQNRSQLPPPTSASYGGEDGCNRKREKGCKQAANSELCVPFEVINIAATLCLELLLNFARVETFAAGVQQR